MAYKFHPLVSANSDSKKAQPGLIALSQALEELFPAQASWGIYNYRTVSGSTSLSHHAEGRAYDVKVLTNKALGDKIAKALLENAWELGLDHVIWFGTKWSAKYPNGTPYKGSTVTLRHEDHIHVGMAWPQALSITKAEILLILGDEEMELIKHIQKALNEAGYTPVLNVDGIWGVKTHNRLVSAFKQPQAAAGGLTPTQVKALINASKIVAP